MSSSLFRQQDEISRRSFAARAARSLLGVGLLPGFLDSARGAAAISQGHQAATARQVIYLYMAGGQSQLDTWDPKEKVPTAGPVKPIATSADGVRISEYLPLTARNMHRAAVIRSLSSTQGAHEQGNYYVHTSYPPLGTIRHPAMGAWLSVLQPGAGHDSLPNYVFIGNDSRHPGAGFFPAEHSPLFVNNPENGVKNVTRLEGLSAERLDKRLALADELDAEFRAAFPHRKVKAYSDMYDGALRMMSSADLVAFDLTKESEAVRKSYGPDPFGQGCLLARRLVEHGVRFVEVSLGNWDTHSANFVGVPDLCAIFDKAYSSLLTDLELRGLLDETLVVVATEFGRTPDINMNVGRDHYPQAFAAVLAGGGIRGGQTHGKTDPEGREVIEDMVTVPSLNASIAWALGLPLQHIIFSPAKRPFTVADKGAPLTGLFG